MREKTWIAMATLAVIVPTMGHAMSACEGALAGNERGLQPPGYPSIAALKSMGYRVLGIIDNHPEVLAMILRGGKNLIITGGALPPLVNGKFPYVLVRGNLNPVYFLNGRIWVNGNEKPGKFVLDAENRLFTETGMSYLESDAGWSYNVETKVSSIALHWYPPGLGVNSKGQLVRNGVVHPEAGSGYSVRSITGDPRDAVGIMGGDLYQNGRLVDYKTQPIVINGEVMPHHLSTPPDIGGGGVYFGDGG